MKGILVALVPVLLAGGRLAGQSLSLYTEISPPSQFLGADGKLTGFSVELVQELQKKVKNTDPIEVIPWVRGYHELQSKPNVALFTIARTEEREHLFQWVGPIREISFQFYVKAGSTVSLTSLEQAKALQRIGVYKEDVREQYLTRMGFTNLDRSLDNLTIVKKLMDGRVDAFVSSPEAVGPILKAAGYSPEEVRGTYTFLRIRGYIAFSKTTPARLVKSWSQALETLKADGTYERLFRKYLPGQPFALPTP